MPADGTLTASSPRWFRQTPLAASCSAYALCPREECDIAHTSVQIHVLLRAMRTRHSCRGEPHRRQRRAHRGSDIQGVAHPWGCACAIASSVVGLRRLASLLLSCLPSQLRARTQLKALTTQSDSKLECFSGAANLHCVLPHND